MAKKSHIERSKSRKTKAKSSTLADNPNEFISPFANNSQSPKPPK